LLRNRCKINKVETFPLLVHNDNSHLIVPPLLSAVLRALLYSHIHSGKETGKKLNYTDKPVSVGILTIVAR